MFRASAAGALFAIALFGDGIPAAAADAPAAAVGATSRPCDPVAAMFQWWNEAIKVPGSFTKEAFERFFTPDATLTLNGDTVIHNTTEWASYFQAIQARGGIVEIVVPFKNAFRSGDELYTYHVIRSRRNIGVPACMLAAGHSVMRGDKIASITLVRTPIPSTGKNSDPDCWAG